MSEDAKEEQPLFRAHSKKKQIWDNIVSLTSALLLVLVLRSSVIEAFKIPSGSMIPTLLIGDQIFVNKFSYGLRVPFTDWIGSRPLYFMRFAPPVRGDIIVFKYPDQPDIYFIKRVVAIPGDTIEIKDKRVYVNDKPFEQIEIPADKLSELYTSIDSMGNEGSRENLKVVYEKFDQDQGTIMVDTLRSTPETMGKVTVPSDSYFVMGDNRDNSRDSRFWDTTHFVPFDNIKGKAVIIWLSMCLFGEECERLNSKTHFERIGKLLH
ncbi:MAG: signal peptidase I [Bdellovibrionales bacterium]|nr:signal peptidase I [Bdellovibrionales bacterium]